MTEIRGFRYEFAFLSNFYPATVSLDGLEYQCVEGAYQAAKTLDVVERKRLIPLNGPAAKRAGRTLRLRRDWYQIRDLYMQSLVFKKFGRHPELCRKLLSTGDARLIEGNYWHDQYWGSCDCARHTAFPGKNMLGKILEETRRILAEQAGCSLGVPPSA